jgi:hypothetical protein
LAILNTKPRVQRYAQMLMWVDMFACNTIHKSIK